MTVDFTCVCKHDKDSHDESGCRAMVLGEGACGCKSYDSFRRFVKEGVFQKMNLCKCGHGYYAHSSSGCHPVNRYGSVGCSCRRYIDNLAEEPKADVGIIDRESNGINATKEEVEQAWENFKTVANEEPPRCDNCDHAEAYHIREQPLRYHCVVLNCDCTQFLVKPDYVFPYCSCGHSSLLHNTITGAGCKAKNCYCQKFLDRRGNQKAVTSNGTVIDPNRVRKISEVQKEQDLKVKYCSTCTHAVNDHDNQGCWRRPCGCKARRSLLEGESIIDKNQIADTSIRTPISQSDLLGLYARIGKELGELVEEKNAAYGDSVVVSAKIVALLYPNGVQPEKYRDLLLTVRIIDKLLRIANKKDAFGESPYKDIAGYGICGAGADERESSK